MPSKLLKIKIALGILEIKNISPPNVKYLLMAED